MKTLIIVRHAKSSWDHVGMSDIERPLNERGKKDAPAMAARLKDKGLPVDLFVSSPAKRAKRTARFFAEAFGLSKENIVIEEQLYEAGVQNFINTVAGFKDKAAVVAVFSHNPGITDFVNTLTNVRVDNMPTCGVFAVQAPVDTWQSFNDAEKNFLFFDYPKNPLGQMQD